MTSNIGRVIERILPGPRELDEPSYAHDIAGEIQRWDERDIVFARADLFRFFGSDSPQYRAYYRAHPEYLAYDTKVSQMRGLGRTGGVDTPMFAAQFDMMRKISTESFVTGPLDVAVPRIEIPPARAALKVKSLARLLGADLVGIGPLRQQWVYSHVGRTRGDQRGYLPWGKPIDLSHHTHAIAMGFQMDYDLIQHAPDFPVLLATAKGYATGAWVSVQLAHYIRMVGYDARAHHFGNYQVLCVPIAVDCGLGELSRAGFLLTKEFGLGLRLAVVTTDMPMVHDKPVDIGVQSFCEQCKICAEQCPIGAIPMGDKVEVNGVKRWKLDEQKCYRYWHASGTDCGICMASCPWTKPPTLFHRVVGALATVKGPYQAWLAGADKLVAKAPWIAPSKGRKGIEKARPRPEFIDPRQR
jgi:ferredoxin